MELGPDDVFLLERCPHPPLSPLQYLVLASMLGMTHAVLTVIVQAFQLRPTVSVTQCASYLMIAVKIFKRSVLVGHS